MSAPNTRRTFETQKDKEFKKYNDEVKEFLKERDNSGKIKSYRPNNVKKSPGGKFVERNIIGTNEDANEALEIIKRKAE